MQRRTQEQDEAGAEALHAHTEENAMEEEICETSEDEEERLEEVCHS